MAIVGASYPKPGKSLLPVFGVSGAVSSLAPLGSTWGAVGDGLTYQGTAPGINSTLDQLQRLMGLRIQPVPEAVMAVGGSTIKTDKPASTQYATVFPYLIDALAAQVPDIFMFLQMGRNDLVLSTDPGASPADGFTTSQVLQDWYDALNRAYTAWLAYAGSDQTKRFIISFSPSAADAITGEATYRVPVWNAQYAKAAGMKATDSRILIADMRDMTDASLWSSDGTQKIHYDERGAYHVAQAIYAVLDPEVVSATDDAIIDMIEAGTYRYMTGTQRDTATGLPGIAGTITGPGVTAVGGSGLATGKTLTNTTGATGITVEQVATTGGRTKTRVNLAGTTSAAGRIYIADTSNLSITGITPGQDLRTYGILRGANFRNMGADAGNYGLWGSTSNASNSSANETHALSSGIFIRPRVAFTTTTSFTPAIKRGFGLSFVLGQALTGTIEFERPGAYLFSNRTAAAPKYIGDTVNSQGTKFFNTFYQMQIRGTVTATSGGTLRVEPGRWNLGGLTETDFSQRQIVSGAVVTGSVAGSVLTVTAVTGGVIAVGQTVEVATGFSGLTIASLGTGTGGTGTYNLSGSATVASQTIWCGTVGATLSGATWTNAFTAGQTTAANLAWPAVTCNNGVATFTARGSTTITVGA